LGYVVKYGRIWPGKPEEIAFDKAGYEKATEVKRQAAQLAAATIALATEYRNRLPAFDFGARHNRTLITAQVSVRFPEI